ncbi:LptF/LptG family permease [Leadbetterella byssophila]|jgi:lipopolysaccharide export system permease protein|uniref:Permease YjgP/YjgQ family protein n=1 Tax=Leadbetterella byssophila (strain DSM 17132 / JCM 16389 / KACC 11308 / NBRC 106382 / 4M15) TaxID=649349 RepID=E4RRM4_LEAB4|nr:LptF/LptG family permease [Leadbetterella byssophila]ADQ16680.1 permease YjgP/YjgQ family protein [Leadbetterella byssophila DSM 17132]
MKKIDKLFVKSYIGPFVLTTAIVVFIFLMRFLMIYFPEFIGKNLDMMVFAKLFFYFTMMTIPMSLPLATLLATLMCFGNLGEKSELTAMKSAGIPITRLIVPTMILSIFVAIFSIGYNNTVNPWANLKGWSLLYDIKTTKPALNIQEGIFYNQIPGYRIKVEKKVGDGQSLKNVIVYDHNTGSGNKNITVADSGRMYTINKESQLVFELYNGVNYSEGSSYNNMAQMTRYSFQKNKIVFLLSSFGLKRSKEEDFTYHEYMKSIPELNEKIDSLNKQIRDKSGQQIIAYKRLDLYAFPEMVGDTLSKKGIVAGAWVDSLLTKVEKITSVQEFNSSARTKLESQKSQIVSDMSFLNGVEKAVWAADLERWNKVTTGFSCLAMFLIGASLGSIIKRGGFGMPVLISIAFFILYYLLQQMGNKYAKEGLISAVVGAWMPFSVLITIGALLMRRAKNF